MPCSGVAFLMSRHPRPRELARRPTVTVVVPCYNYGHHLPFAVETILAQPGVEVDIIAIDDASPDRSASVVRQLADGDPRITAIVHEQNRGHVATYNEGLEMATGEYVALMSADDALTPGALARATALMDTEPSVGFVYGFPVHFTGEPPPTDTKIRSWTVWSGREWIERRCRRADNCIASPEVVLRTSVQHAIGGYDPELPFSGDLEMWLRAASAGTSVGSTDRRRRTTGCTARACSARSTADMSTSSRVVWQRSRRCFRGRRCDSPTASSCSPRHDVRWPYRPSATPVRRMTMDEPTLNPWTSTSRSQSGSGRRLISCASGDPLSSASRFGPTDSIAVLRAQIDCSSPT